MFYNILFLVNNQLHLESGYNIVPHISIVVIVSSRLNPPEQDIEEILAHAYYPALASAVIAAAEARDGVGGHSVTTPVRYRIKSE